MRRVLDHFIAQFALFLLSLTLCGLSSCQKQRDLWVYESVGMDAQVVVKISDKLSAAQKEQLSSALSKEIERIEGLVSLQRKDSFVSRLNAERSLDAVDKDFYSALELSQDFFRHTGGLFDITVQPLWNWYWSQSLLPEEEQEEQIPAELLEKIGFHHLQLEAGRVSLGHSEAMVTLNGIGQGMVTDAIYELLKNFGIKSALINAGEYRALGAPEWTVEFGGKKEGGHGIWGSATIQSGQAIAVSSGSGYIFSSLKAQPHHIIHPSGEQPTRLPRSVAILAPDATTADALATSLCIASSAQRAAILAHFQDVEVWFEEY